MSNIYDKRLQTSKNPSGLSIPTSTATRSATDFEIMQQEHIEQLETELADKNRQLSREIALRKTAEAEVAEFRASSDWYEKFRVERNSHLATQSTLADAKELLAEARAEIERLREKIKGCSTCKHRLPENDMVEVCLNQDNCCRTTAWRVTDRTTLAKRESWPDLWEEEL